MVSNRATSSQKLPNKPGSFCEDVNGSATDAYNEKLPLRFDQGKFYLFETESG